MRRILLATATLAGTFYVGSTFVAFKNQTYYDFFSDHVPLGQSTLEYAEAHHWDTMTVHSAIDSAKKTLTSTQQFVTDKINGTPRAVDQIKHKVQDTKEASLRSYQDSKAQAKSVVEKIKTEVQKTGDSVGIAAKHQAQQFSEEIQELIWKAEQALTDSYPSHIKGSASDSESSPSPSSSSPTSSTNHVYDAPLPVGFEPPPGYSRPAPTLPTKEAEPAELPTPSLTWIAPAISSLNSSEPIISHLAGTIDDLASYAKSNPQAASQVAPVLENAKNELTALAARIDAVRDEERVGLEAKMDEQTREYTLKLLELEMAAQDSLDSQEDDFRKFFEQERTKLVENYREKLDHELKAQTELINER